MNSVAINIYIGIRIIYTNFSNMDRRKYNKIYVVGLAANK